VREAREKDEWKCKVCGSLYLTDLVGNPDDIGGWRVNLRIVYGILVQMSVICIFIVGCLVYLPAFILLVINYVVYDNLDPQPWMNETVTFLSFLAEFIIAVYVAFVITGWKSSYEYQFARRGVLMSLYPALPIEAKV
jgi:hypothetical protein